MRKELTTAARHTVVYGFGKVFGKAVSFFLIPFYTYYLMPADYGVMEILNLTSMIVTMLIALGMPLAVMRFYYDTDDPEEKKAVISTGLFFSLVLSGAVALIGVVGARPVSQFLLGSPNYTLLVRLVAAAFFFTASADIAYSYLRAKQRSVTYAVLSQVYLFISVGLNIYLIAFRKMGVAGVFWGMLAAGAVLWVVLMVLTLPEVGLRFSRAKLKALLHFGTPLLLLYLSAFVLNYSDRFFLQRYTGLAEVGLYSLAYKFGFMVNLLLIQPFQLMWEVQAYEISGQPNASKVFARFFQLYAVGLLGAALAISLLIPEVFRIMVDAKFRSGYPLVPLVAFAYAAQGMAMFLQAGLMVQKKSRTIAKIALACTIVALTLNAVLIYAFGMWGAATATIIGFSVTAVVTYRSSRRWYPVPYDVKPIFSTVALCGVLILVGWALPLKAMWASLPLKAVLLGVFVLLLPRLGVVRADELRTAREYAVGWVRKRLSPKLARAQGA